MKLSAPQETTFKFLSDYGTLTHYLTDWKDGKPVINPYAAEFCVKAKSFLMGYRLSDSERPALKQTCLNSLQNREYHRSAAPWDFIKAVRFAETAICRDARHNPEKIGETTGLQRSLLDAMTDYGFLDDFHTVLRNSPEQANALRAFFSQHLSHAALGDEESIAALRVGSERMQFYRMLAMLEAYPSKNEHTPGLLASLRKTLGQAKVVTMPTGRGI